MKEVRNCEIISRRQEGDTVILELKAGSLVRTSYRGPGQFLQIQCGDGLLLRRPISVCTCRAEEPEDRISLAFEVRGEGTRWLAGRREGDLLNVLGLLGNGFTVSKGNRYLLAGGGIGVPPLLGCAESAQGNATAVLGFRSREKTVLMEEFQKKCARVLVTTDDGSLGFHGFVDGAVREELQRDPGYDAVLACGPRPMLKSVAAAAAEFGIPCQVSMEERMGCGVGACLVCACRSMDGSYRHVCRDGPVFDAQEVDWNE